MSENICRDTATSAIWKVAYRPWLTTFPPSHLRADLDELPAQVGLGHGSDAIGQAPALDLPIEKAAQVDGLPLHGNRRF
jgi:hypothetical protein